MCAMELEINRVCWLLFLCGLVAGQCQTQTDMCKVADPANGGNVTLSIDQDGGSFQCWTKNVSARINDSLRLEFSGLEGCSVLTVNGDQASPLIASSAPTDPFFTLLLMLPNFSVRCLTASWELCVDISVTTPVPTPSPTRNETVAVSPTQTPTQAGTPTPTSNETSTSSPTASSEAIPGHTSTPAENSTDVTTPTENSTDVTTPTEKPTDDKRQLWGLFGLLGLFFGFAICVLLVWKMCGPKLRCWLCCGAGSGAGGGAGETAIEMEMERNGVGGPQEQEQGREGGTVVTLSRSVEIGCHAPKPILESVARHDKVSQALVCLKTHCAEDADSDSDCRGIPEEFQFQFSLATSPNLPFLSHGPHMECSDPPSLGPFDVMNFSAKDPKNIAPEIMMALKTDIEKKDISGKMRPGADDNHSLTYSFPSTPSDSSEPPSLTQMSSLILPSPYLPPRSDPPFHTPPTTASSTTETNKAALDCDDSGVSSGVSTSGSDDEEGSGSAEKKSENWTASWSWMDSVLDNDVVPEEEEIVIGNQEDGGGEDDIEYTTQPKKSRLLSRTHGARSKKDRIVPLKKAGFSFTLSKSEWRVFNSELLQRELVGGIDTSLSHDTTAMACF